LLYEAVSTHGVDVVEFSFRTPLWALRAADVWHLHWPEADLNRPLPWALLGWFRMLLALLLCRIWGVKVVWTVHNLRPHEGNRLLLKKLIFRALERAADGFIFLSNATLEAGCTAMGEAIRDRSVVIQHGHYGPCYPHVPSRTEARQQLGVPHNHRMLLYFGLIRPYKNVPTLLDAFREVQGDTLRLIVVGDPGRNRSLDCEIEERAKRDPRVDYRKGFLDRKSVV
jgi:glycosyltransferase involved in cell wall biosynthesis